MNKYIHGDKYIHRGGRRCREANWARVRLLRIIGPWAVPFQTPSGHSNLSSNPGPVCGAAPHQTRSALPWAVAMVCVIGVWRWRCSRALAVAGQLVRPAFASLRAVVSTVEKGVWSSDQPGWVLHGHFLPLALMLWSRGWWGGAPWSWKETVRKLSRDLGKATGHVCWLDPMVANVRVGIRPPRLRSVRRVLSVARSNPLPSWEMVVRWHRWPETPGWRNRPHR